MKALINKLVETAGPSGYEAQIRQTIRALIEPWADELSVDNLGNLIARFGNPSPQGRNIMLAAHMDEIGIVATHIDARGFIRFIPVGGLRPQSLPGGRVRFLSGVVGVIGIEQKPPEGGAPKFADLFIDVGASRKEDCPIKVGDFAVMERDFIDLGERLVAKAMDDRIGVAILIETLRRLKEGRMAIPHQVYFVFSAQEEVGLRGATTAAFGINPELGLAIDVTSCGDTPKGPRMAVELGKGPAIKVRDQGMIADARLVSWMVATAERIGVDYQMEVLEHGGTDAHAIQLTRAGVPAGCLSIPCRYIHTPSEMVDLRDVRQAVELLLALLSTTVEL